MPTATGTTTSNNMQPNYAVSTFKSEDQIETRTSRKQPNLADYLTKLRRSVEGALGDGDADADGTVPLLAGSSEHVPLLETNATAGAIINSSLVTLQLATECPSGTPPPLPPPPAATAAAPVQHWRVPKWLLASLLSTLLLAVIFYCYHFTPIFKLPAYTVPNVASMCRSLFSDQAARQQQLQHFEQMVQQSNVSLEERLHYILRDSDQSPDLLVTWSPPPSTLPSSSSPSLPSLSSDLAENGYNNEEEQQQSYTGGLNKCSHYSCFDIYRCGTPHFNPYQYPKHLKRNVRELIKVYVYPNYRFVSTTTNEPYRLPFSGQFTRMLHTIVNSPYYTSNPWEACLFIVNVDLLNADLVDLPSIERILWSLPHFHTGSNHLIFSMMFPPNSPLMSHFGIDIGSSMVAGAGYNLHRYRSQFDVAIPVYSVFSQLYEREQQLQLVHFNIGAITALARKWSLICTQTNLVSLENRYYLKRLESIYSNKMLLLYWDCAPSTSRQVHSPIGHLFHHQTNSTTATRLYTQTLACNHDRKISTRYLDALHNSDFCLIIKTTPLDSPLLSDALMSGCVPVIMSDTLVLPFEERIDWTSVAIRVWEHSTNELFDILNLVTPERIRQLRLNGLHVWRQYFSSVENITRTTLDIINERVFPKPRKAFSYSVKHFAEVTPLTLDYYSNGFNFITPKQVYLQTNGFTTIILSYNRVDSLFEVVMSVARVPSCVKIVVVWNNQNLSPPAMSKWPQIGTPVQVILADSNKLSNRFYPYSSIETEAIFAIDDDITMLNPDEIEFAYQTWREFPDRIVGFPSRLHHWDNYTQQWEYDSEWRNQISLILTGAAFYHNYYNFLYTFVMPANIRDWVDSNMNCEDIAMNFLVSNITRVAPIKVTPRKKFKCPECNTRNNKLSVDALNHLQLRSKCIDYFAGIYQMIPLKSVEFRSNPVLYGDNIPDKLKHFNLIGNL